MKEQTFIIRLIQLNNSFPYFSTDCVRYVVTSLPDNEVKEILYHAMHNLWRKKMTKQGYNYLDRSIQEISGFFETRVENREAPAPPLAVRSLPREKKKKSSKKRKAVSLEDFDENSSDNKKPPSKKKFSQYHRKRSHSTEECTKLEVPINTVEPNNSKGYKKGRYKTYTKHKVNILIEKNLKKALKR